MHWSLQPYLRYQLFALHVCVRTADGLVSSAPVYIPHWVSPPRKRYFSLHRARVSSRYGLSKKQRNKNGQWLAPEPQTYILKTYHPLRSPSPKILKIPLNFLGSFLVNKTEEFPPSLPRVWRCNKVWMRWIPREVFDDSLTFRLYGFDVNETDYTGLFKMTVRVLTTCHTQYTWDSTICIFLFNRTTLQVFVTYLTGALYVHHLWFYKHQHENRVRSKLNVFLTMNQYHMLHVHNYILLKMSTWGSKHVEENIILRIHNNHCIKLVVNI